MRENKRAVRNKDITNGIAMHVITTNHSIDWNKAQILITESNWLDQKRTRDKSGMNMDTGMQLDKTWSQILMHWFLCLFVNNIAV